MKLTKKILERLIKEELTLTGKAQAEEFLKLLPKKNKVSMLKKVFKVLKFLNKATQMPIWAAHPLLMNIKAYQMNKEIMNAYKKDGTDAALLKAAELIAENIPWAGELMALDELIKYIAPSAVKSFKAAKQFSLTTDNPATRRAAGFMRLKGMQESKSKLS